MSTIKVDICSPHKGELDEAFKMGILSTVSRVRRTHASFLCYRRGLRQSLKGVQANLARKANCRC